MPWWPVIDPGSGEDRALPWGHDRARPIRSVLCALDRRAATAGDVVDLAVEAAAANAARLTLMAVVRRPTPMVAMAGQTVAQVLEAAEREALGWLSAALATVPEAVPAGVVLRVGRPAAAILREVAWGEHDLVVLGRRPCGRAPWPRLASVGRRVAGRAGTPVVTVPVP
jgi:nucleotide-binding universal stress UspA family protein